MTATAESTGVRILVRGNFERQDLKVLWQGDTEALTKANQEAIARFWQRFKRSRPRAQSFDGELCALLGFRATPDRLHLTLGRTTYSHLIYSNRYAAELVEAGRRHLLSRALGVSAVVRTSDRRIVVLRRSKTVGEAPGMLDVVGGHIKPPDPGASRTPDPFQAITEEVHEELNLPPASTEDWRCLGVVETLNTLKPELIFVVRFAGDARKVRELCERARDRFEFHTICPVAESEISSFLERRKREVSPSALGALQLYMTWTR